MATSQSESTISAVRLAVAVTFPGMLHLPQIFSVPRLHADGIVVNANVDFAKDAAHSGLATHEGSAVYRFSTSLPYLLTRLGTRMSDLFARELAWDGLTLQMFRVLAVLIETEEPQRLGAVSALTSIEMSTLSRLLIEMQRRGLITRERPENDQRSLSVLATPTGAALAARLIPRAAEYERLALGDLGPTRAAALKTELVQIYQRLDAIEGEIAAAEANRDGGKRRVAAGGGA
jgi:DNA-binding MarR family transcriptional regulator